MRLKITLAPDIDAPALNRCIQMSILVINTALIYL